MKKVTTGQIIFGAKALDIHVAPRVLAALPPIYITQEALDGGSGPESAAYFLPAFAAINPEVLRKIKRHLRRVIITSLDDVWARAQEGRIPDVGIRPHDGLYEDGDVIVASPEESLSPPVDILLHELGHVAYTFLDDEELADLDAAAEDDRWASPYARQTQDNEENFAEAFREFHEIRHTAVSGVIAKFIARMSA